MLFEEISIQDKMGRTVVFRNARPEDSADLIKYLKTTSAETPYLIREPDEITITEEKEKQFIQSKIDDERELMLVALIDGKHIGNCSLMSIAPYKRYNHRCDVSYFIIQRILRMRYREGYAADYSRCCKKRGLRTGGARSDGREQGCYCHV